MKDMSLIMRTLLSMVYFLIGLMQSFCVICFAWGYDFEWVFGHELSHVATRFALLVVAMFIYGSSKSEGML